MTMIRWSAGLAAIGSLCVSVPALAQVAYAPTPYYYGYPVPGGVLQPNEVLGTSPSFQILPTPYGPAVRVIERCQYPDGWNSTDFSRDLNGIPAGVGHTCPRYTTSTVRARF